MPLLDSLKEEKIRLLLLLQVKTGHSYLKKWVLHLTLMRLPTRQKQQTETCAIYFLLAAKAVGLKQKMYRIEDAQAGIQAILSSGAQPIGVGRAERPWRGDPACA